jgi:hypothetical protein
MSTFRVRMELEMDGDSWADAVASMKSIQETVEDIYDVALHWAPGDVTEMEPYVRPPYPTEGGLATDWPDDIDGDSEA